MAELPAPDLTECDREPIHLPGAIQPHGLLIVVDEAGTIVGCAGDFERHLGRTDAPLGLSVERLLGADTQRRLAGTGHRGILEVRAGSSLDVTSHRHGPLLIVELEPVDSPPPSAAEALARVQDAARAIALAHSPIAACQAAAATVQQITGYDRVMVYRFLGDGAGRVIAEALSEASETLLHQHFPATDIPQQARALYVRNRIRLIPDVAYTPAPLIGDAGVIDMSDCILRSVSPIHLQYLRNMGVAASASVSIVVDDKLWGLIACHANAPRAIPHEARQLCCLIAELLATDIARRADAATHAQALRYARRREELLPLLLDMESIEAALDAWIADIAALLPCDGVAIWSDGTITVTGSTPDEASVSALAHWLLRRDTPVFASSHLGAAFPPAEAFAGAASGLAASVVRREPGLVLMWFRAEQVEAVNWAGNPHKAVEGPAGMLTPRTSFDLWRETVRGRSAPWTDTEIEAARRFGEAVCDLARQKNLADLNRQLRTAVSARDEIIDKKDLLMREVHHRVQNSLQLVTSMLHIQAADVDDEAIRHQFELARQRVMAVAMAHRRLWRADEADTINLDTFLEEIGESLVESWGPAWDGQLVVRVAPVRVATGDAVILALLVTELLTNAVKHAYDGAVGPLELRAEQKSEGGALEVSVCDRGKGFAGAEKAGSFGSRLTRGLVRQLKGRIDFLDNGPGTRATLTLPDRVV